MDSCCRCRRVCKLVMFLLGVASISATGFLLHHTIAILRGHGNVCTLWLDMVGRFTLFVVGYCTAGICGCLPFPDTFRPQGFPEPFFIWKLYRVFFKYSRNCVRVFRICAYRTRTSSRTPLLEDIPDFLGLPQWNSPLPVAIPGLASSRTNSTSEELPEPEVVSGTYQPEIQIFHFDESQPSDAEMLEECRHPVRYPPECRRHPNRPRHPTFPWKLLRQYYPRSRRPKDPILLNLSGVYQYNSPVNRGLTEGAAAENLMCNRGSNIVNPLELAKRPRRVRSCTVPGTGRFDPMRAAIPSDLEVSCAVRKRLVSPKTASEPNTSQDVATGYEHLDSTMAKRLTYLDGAKGACAAWEKPILHKAICELDTSEDAATGHDQLNQTRTERFLDPKGIWKESISPKATSKLDTSEGAATEFDTNSTEFVLRPNST